MFPVTKAFEKKRAFNCFCAVKWPKTVTNRHSSIKFVNHLVTSSRLDTNSFAFVTGALQHRFRHPQISVHNTIIIAVIINATYATVIVTQRWYNSNVNAPFNNERIAVFFYISNLKGTYFKLKISLAYLKIPFTKL